jgi:hypothetical protein
MQKETSVEYGTIFLYAEKKGEYTVDRGLFRIPAKIRHDLTGDEAWRNKTKHPTFYDEETKAMMVFRSVEDYVKYLEKERTRESVEGPIEKKVMDNLEARIEKLEQKARSRDKGLK